MSEEKRLTEAEWAAEMDRREDERERQEREKAQQEARERAAKEDRRREEYMALPAIKRLERWGETHSWPMGSSLMELARALREWAIEEQQKKKD